MAKSIRRREVITRAAVGATFLIAWPLASRPQQVIYSGGEIVPGERIGPVQLRGKIDEVKQLFGPGILAIEGGRRRPQLFSLQAWNAIGLSVQFDSTTGNVVWISVEVGPASEAWAEYVPPKESAFVRDGRMWLLVWAHPSELLRQEVLPVSTTILAAYASPC